VTKGRDTTQEFEFGISASPTGREAAQVVWNDVSLGRVEVVSLDGVVAPLVLTTEIGRYAFPSFSPTGNKVVFTKRSSDSLSGPLYTQRTGIYVVDLVVDESSGRVTGVDSPPRLITTGTRATFAAAGNSLLVQRGTQVVQVFLDGSAGDRVLTTCKYCTSTSVSPDLAFVAYVDLFELYLAPLTSFPLELSSKPGFTPPEVRRLSPNGGDYLSWPAEGISATVSFLLGATLNLIDTKAVFSCPAGEDNDYGLACVQSLTTAIDLSITVQTNIPQTSLVLDNALLVTMTGDEASSVIPNGRIVILGDKIQALGPRDQVPIPGGARVIDVEGGVVMPGLIDAHAHWSGKLKKT